jgi:hypothetical protein
LLLRLATTALDGMLLRRVFSTCLLLPVPAAAAA